MSKALMEILVAAFLFSLASPTLAGGGAQVRKLLEPRELPAIGYIKVHKTGSSTMTNILNRLACHRRLHVLRPEKGGKIIWTDITETPHHQYDMVNNHGVFNETAMRAYLREPARTFTMLREPLAVMDSKARFHQENGVNKQKGGFTWRDHIDAMVSRRNKWANPMARDLGWYRGLDIRHEPVEGMFRNDADATAIGTFVQQIDNGLDLVLLMEHYDRGLLLLRRLLGLSLDDVRYVRHRTSIVTDKAPPTAAELEQLKPFIAVDQAVYAHFSRKFWRLWEAAGGDAAFAHELAELQARSEALNLACGERDLPRNERRCPDEFLMGVRNFSEIAKRIGESDLTCSCRLFPRLQRR